LAVWSLAAPHSTWQSCPSPPLVLLCTRLPSLGSHRSGRYLLSFKRASTLSRSSALAARWPSFSRISPVGLARPPSARSTQLYKPSLSRCCTSRFTISMNSYSGVHWKLAVAKGEIMEKNGLSCFLLGLGVGVEIGMLFAPKSGQETREIIKNKAGEGTEYIKQRGSEFKDTAAGWVDKSKEAVGRQKETLSDAVEASKLAYRDAVSQNS